MLLPRVVSIKKISQYIDSCEFNEYNLQSKQNLEIEDMEYNLEQCDDYKRTNDGYPEQYTGASYIFDTNSIIFYLKSIKDLVEGKFEHVMSQEVVDKISEIYIKYCFVHEQIHILQIKEGRLTKEISQSQKDIPYEERELENEAFSEASRIIKSYGEFETKVIELIESKMVDNNDIANEIERLYYQKKTWVDL